MQEDDSGKEQYQKPTPEKREQLEQVVEGGVIVLTTGAVALLECRTRLIGPSAGRREAVKYA